MRLITLQSASYLATVARLGKSAPISSILPLIPFIHGTIIALGLEKFVIDNCWA